MGGLCPEGGRICHCTGEINWEESQLVGSHQRYKLDTRARKQFCLSDQTKQQWLIEFMSHARRRVVSNRIRERSWRVTPTP